MWYDKKARERTLEPGDEVLVLLPTSSSKLTAQWQAPYHIVKAVGRVNYHIRMPDRRKRLLVFHINMLQQWHAPVADIFLLHSADESESGNIPFWKDGAEGEATVGSHLGEEPEQLRGLNTLLERFKDVFQVLPGHTTVTEHQVETGQRPQFDWPHTGSPRLSESVYKELKEMLDHGVIKPSTCDWASPMVTVRKDATVRICVDYRRLNSFSVRSHLTSKEKAVLYFP